jgi:hypothetical protein
MQFQTKKQLLKQLNKIGIQNILIINKNRNKNKVENTTKAVNFGTLKASYELIGFITTEINMTDNGKIASILFLIIFILNSKTSTR